MNKFNDSVRDYRRYLSFDPIPNDFKDIQKELDEMIDLKAKEEKDYQQRQKAYQQSHPNPRPQSARYNNHTNNSNHSSSSTSQQQKAYNRRSTGGMKDAFGNDFDPFSTFGAADFDEEGFDTGDLKVSLLRLFVCSFIPSLISFYSFLLYSRNITIININNNKNLDQIQILLNLLLIRLIIITTLIRMLMISILIILMKKKIVPILLLLPLDPIITLNHPNSSSNNNNRKDYFL